MVCEHNALSQRRVAMIEFSSHAISIVATRWAFFLSGLQAINDLPKLRRPAGTKSANQRLNNNKSLRVIEIRNDAQASYKLIISLLYVER